MRAAAGADYDLAMRMMRWPLAEVLLRYLHVARLDQVAHYRHRNLLHAIQQGYAAKRLTPPMPPPLLRDDAKDGD